MERERPKKKEPLPRPGGVSARGCSEGTIIFKRHGIVPGGMCEREMATVGERRNTLEKVTRFDVSVRVVSRICSCMFAVCVTLAGDG